MNNLASDCKRISQDIAQYLVGYLNENKSFKLRSFYGESFALNLIQRHGLLTVELKKILINEYKIKNKENPEFHFEFNNYAFSDLLNRESDQEISSLYQPLKFKGTKCTNWTLLRSNVRFAEREDIKIALQETKDKIHLFQQKNGLILDDIGVKSFQYHCFSAAMLIEIFDRTCDQEIHQAFLKAVAFIRNFILSNGDTLYIGRGQEQSFGLGVLIYILSRYFEETKKQEVLRELQSVLTFIKKFQYSTGAFPLVFTGNEKEVPSDVDMLSVQFCGWYPYNNFFDYLPFMGFFLHKSYEILSKLTLPLSEISEIGFLHKDYRDDAFIKVHKTKYTAILSLPGGYWTNDLPFPLILYKNQFITPVLGGEQFQKSLYTYESLSLPITKIGKISWRKFGRGFFLGNTLLWFSPFGILCRSFKFEEERIVVNNFSVGWVPSEQNFSFLSKSQRIDDRHLKSDCMEAIFSSDIHSIKKGHSASGELQIVKTKMNVKVNLEIM